MQNPMATQVHYREHQSQVAWVNENDWQFERPAKRYRVRKAITRMCVTFAGLFALTKRQPQSA